MLCLPMGSNLFSIPQSRWESSQNWEDLSDSVGPASSFSTKQISLFENNPLIIVYLIVFHFCLFFFLQIYILPSLY